MEKFSAAIKLSDLNDLAPSQACVKPLIVERQTGKKAKIEVKSDGTYLEIENDGTEKILEKAKISLQDCLACSGCITSAETMLITAQSVQEFMDTVKKQDRTTVVSISPQSRASLAAHFKLDILQVHKKLITFFKKLGVQYVFDTSFSREFSLMEAAAEFVARYRKQMDAPLPMLASACPGWICLAEKSHGDYVLPYISTTKSPQQIMGSIVKDHFAKIINKKPDEIYHVTVMPCYDKKLEASRSDFYDDLFKTRDVDSVLATTEIIDLIKQENVDFPSLEESPIDKLFTNITEEDRLFGISGGSGGYLEYIFRYAAKELFGVTVDKIEYESKGPDYNIATLNVDGKPVLTFAAAYGMRHIPNILRTIKGNTRRAKFDFVEIMACPGGCLSGGGQIKDASKKPRETLAIVEEAYNRQLLAYPEQNQQAQDLYKVWLEGVFTPLAKTKLHTQYHAVQKSVHSIAVQW